MKIFLIMLLLTGCAYAGDITVTTGFGYYKNSDGNIESKAQLPKGKHQIKDGYTYIEVANQAELNSVVIPKKEFPKTDIEKRIDDIEKRLEKMEK